MIRVKTTNDDLELKRSALLFASDLLRNTNATTSNVITEARKIENYLREGLRD